MPKHCFNYCYLTLIKYSNTILFWTYTLILLANLEHIKEKTKAQN
jgi:hypothetical protein